MIEQRNLFYVHFYLNTFPTKKFPNKMSILFLTLIYFGNGCEFKKH